MDAVYREAVQVLELQLWQTRGCDDALCPIASMGHVFVTRSRSPPVPDV